MKYKHLWDKETKTATCIYIIPNGIQFVGVAKCHPDDDEFCSEITGGTIAESRAFHKYLKYCLREQKQELTALKHLQSSIQYSKQHNPDSYETKMLGKAIKLHEEDIDFLRKELVIHDNYIKNYIESLDRYHQRLKDKGKEN